MEETIESMAETIASQREIELALAQDTDDLDDEDVETELEDLLKQQQVEQEVVFASVPDTEIPGVEDLRPDVENVDRLAKAVKRVALTS